MKDLKTFLDRKVDEYNQPSFISADPISVPHRFSGKQDREISGFFASIFAWGNRTLIIKKSLELMQLMDNAPYQFITEHSETDLKPFLQFRHRTFNTTDLLYFIAFLKYHYEKESSLESAFTIGLNKNEETIEKGLVNFHDYFFSLPDAPNRTRKHIATPKRGSTCKRLNMFLRWMVRDDGKGVDFGIWKTLQPCQLVCPVDVHVARVATRFGLLQSKTVNWKTAVELTQQLRAWNAEDPVRYDFALFGLGVMEKF